MKHVSASSSNPHDREVNLEDMLFGISAAVAAVQSRLERFNAERRRRDDPGEVDVLALQQPGAVVAGDQVVGVARDGYRQQKSIEGIVASTSADS